MHRLYLLSTFLLAACSVNSAPAAERPNIVVILADDFGVGDIQAHYPDNKIATPHLDRLVRQGVSFTDAHSPSAVCSPTRYGLLTGRYAWRTRLQEWVIAAYEPPLIAEGRPTLPGFLRRNGYHTACIGKWHLGWRWPGTQPSRMTEERNGQAFLQWDFTKAIRGGPTQRGFDYYFGVDLPNLPPFTFLENERVVTQPTESYELNEDEGDHLPERFVGAPMAPGWRFQEILPELTRRAVKYIHQRAEQDAPFFVFFSMTSPHEPIVPSKKFRGRSGIAPTADFVMETDWSAGQVIGAIDEAGVAGDTIVIFTADNGHSHYTGWEELVEAGHMPSGPYRGHKGDIWEGGHRVPLVVRWPNRLDAGTSSDQLVCLTDLFATCADIIGTDLPADGAEDSLSFLAELLRKPNDERRTALVSHSNFGEFAYRDGPWKLVFKMGGENLDKSRGKPTIAELYHLESDIGEQSDLSCKHPKIVAQMTKQLQLLIERGTSRAGQKASNDTVVRFDTIQRKRWGVSNGNSVARVAAEETTVQKYVVSVERIWDRAGHSAFTDLVRFRGDLYCTFREGSGHIPGRNGLIRVIRSRDGMNWESIALLEEQHVDLRDPKLSVTPDGRLMINCGASHYHGSKRKRIESRVAFYDHDADRFGPPQKVVLPESIVTGFDWLWRITWHDGWAWGCVQQVPDVAERSLHLVRSRDGINYERVTQLDVDHPTETTLRFLGDKTMIAMIRRTGSSPEGWIGKSEPPYTKWNFITTNKRFGGPNLVQLPGGSWLAGSRGYEKRRTTDLWRLDLETGRFHDLLSLPSGGDTSYPGLVLDEERNRLLVSYYSSHEGKAAIYLATLRLNVLMEQQQTER